MTEKEAIKILQELSLERCETFRFDCGNCDKCKVTKAYSMAIKALEKQIPKKPHKTYEKVNLKWCECGNYLGELKNEQNYCKRCGHALNWGDEECGS